jgi:hypothetical protein
MVPDQRFTMLGLEYFCFEGDALWSASDEELIAIASTELATLDLASSADVVDGVVVRQSNAYPMYDHSYSINVARVRDFLGREACNLQVAGRNGMHNVFLAGEHQMNRGARTRAARDNRRHHYQRRQARIAQNKMIVRVRMVAPRGMAHGTSATARIIPWYSRAANAIAAAATATQRPLFTFSSGREAR